MNDQGIYINSDKLHKKIKRLVELGHRNILITSPIETGKSSFIYENLITDKDIHSVVMLSNRTLLKEQVKNELYLRRINHKSDKDNKAYCYQSIGNVLFGDEDEKKKFRKQFQNDNQLSDEEAEKIFQDVEQFISEDIKEVDYLILDEAHYFTSDSVFNDKTMKEFEYIYKECKGVKLYMTATPEAFIEAIKQYEKANNIKGKDRLTIIKQLKQVTESDIEDFDYITADKEAVDLLKHVKERYEFQFIHEADRENFLKEQVKISTPNDKMIYFTTDKLRGFAVAQQANGMKYRDDNAKGGAFICTLYDSVFKTAISMTERERIIQQGRFNSDVLVATAVLDNGVNIKDDNVKRVIIDYVDAGEVVQMLGRVRTKNRAKGNKLNVTVILPSLEKIENVLKRKDEDLKKAKNIFEEQQIEFSHKCYDEIKQTDWLNETRIKNDESVLNGKPDVPVYFAHLYYLLVNYDVYYCLKDSPYYIEPKGLERLRECYIDEKNRMIQEQKERAEKKEREQRIKELKRISNIQACFAKYGDRELLKNEFDMLANELNFKSKDSKLLKTATKINEHLSGYGYKITSIRKMIEGERNTLYKLEKL